MKSQNQPDPIIGNQKKETFMNLFVAAKLTNQKDWSVIIIMENQIIIIYSWGQSKLKNYSKRLMLFDFWKFIQEIGQNYQSSMMTHHRDLTHMSHIIWVILLLGVPHY